MSAMLQPDPLPAPASKKQSYWRLVARQYRRRRMSVAALVLLAVLAFVAILAPLLAGGKPIYLFKDGKTYWFPNFVKYDDLVLFDAGTIIDRATFEKPKQPAAGIDLVLVNGVAVWRNGESTGKRPGRALRRATNA